jgi:tetratricopeptide (TPR) repeat protein
MGSPSESAVLAYRRLRLPWKRPQVLRAGLHRSESNAYAAAEAIIQQAGRFAPADVLQALRAPSFVWRARKYATAVVGRQIFRELAGTLAGDQNVGIDADLVDEKHVEFKDKALMSDKRLLGLLKGNLARFQYEQLRDFGGDIDVDKVEKTFKAALDLCPDEPFIFCWYGTFLKEIKRDYAAAESNYRQALTLSRSVEQDWIRNHPIFENNLALLFMDGVYRQIYPSAYLQRAYRLLSKALQKLESGEGRFQWPVITMEQLKAQASEFSEQIPV